MWVHGGHQSSSSGTARPYCNRGFRFQGPREASRASCATKSLKSRTQTLRSRPAGRALRHCGRPGCRHRPPRRRRHRCQTRDHRQSRNYRRVSRHRRQTDAIHAFHSETSRLAGTQSGSCQLSAGVKGAPWLRKSAIQRCGRCSTCAAT